MQRCVLSPIGAYAPNAWPEGAIPGDITIFRGQPAWNELFGDSAPEPKRCYRFRGMIYVIKEIKE